MVQNPVQVRQGDAANAINRAFLIGIQRAAFIGIIAETDFINERSPLKIISVRDQVDAKDRAIFGFQESNLYGPSQLARD